MLRVRVKSQRQTSGLSLLNPMIITPGKRSKNVLIGIILQTMIAILLITIGCWWWLAPLNTRKTGSTSSISGSLRVAQQLPNAAATAVRDKTLVISTTIGDLRITLRSELSPESVNYIEQVVLDGTCSPCNLYRVEEPGILQGILKNPHIPISTIPKGQCPPEAANVPNQCPPHDSQCGCHGPVMTRGMVGWAAGDTGPDWFINVYKRPATWWGTQHTVWGIITDAASFTIIEDIWKLPTEKQGGLTYLIDPIHFDLRIEN